MHEWHIQESGSGKRVLLLHGAGGSVHSFAELFPLLAHNYHVFAPDLPGHGFTRLGAQRRSGLVPMAEDLLALCDAQGFAPEVIIGHSAGGAIALQIARSHPDLRIIGLNPALDHFEGLAGVVFPAMAKLLAAVPFTARLFSGVSSRPDRVQALIDSTGSVLSPEGVRLYQRLVSRESHVSGALAMMSQWALQDLITALPDIRSEVLFVTGENDKTVPPSVSDKAAQALPSVHVECLPGLGHLLHEEDPKQIAEICTNFISA